MNLPRLIPLALLMVSSLHAQMPDPPGQAKAGEPVQHEAYLFAHMLHGDYGRLYYSISRDGLHWELLPITRKQCDALIGAFGSGVKP